MCSNCILLKGLRALQGMGCQQVMNPAAAYTHTHTRSVFRQEVVGDISLCSTGCSAVSQLPATSPRVCPLLWHQHCAEREGTMCGGRRGAGQK